MKSAAQSAIDRIRAMAPPTGDARRAMMDERLSPMAQTMLPTPAAPTAYELPYYIDDMGNVTLKGNTLEGAFNEFAGLDQGVDRNMFIPWNQEAGWHVPELLRGAAQSAYAPGHVAGGGAMTMDETLQSGVDIGGTMFGGATLFGPRNALAMGGGKGGSVADALSGVADDLPMDTASQMARANQTFPVDAWHGSPRNITEFRNTYSTPEGYYGANHYFTNSIDDVNANYAGYGGPDITQRIQREIELAADSFDDDTILDYWQYRDVDVDDIADLSQGQIDEALDAVARERLGIENDGTVYPVRLAMNNPVKVGGDGETFFDYNIKYSADGEDVVGEDGPLLDLLEATQEAFDEWQIDQYTRDDVLGKLMDDAVDGGISASDFDNILRSNINEVYDDFSGEMASPGAVIADIFKKAGFDSIDMDASVFSNRQGFGGVKLPGMTGTQDARHYVIFDDNANQIRSRFAKFDPRNIKSRNLLASGLGGLLGLGLLGNSEAEAGQ